MTVVTKEVAPVYVVDKLALTVNLGRLSEVVEEAGKIALTPEAEVEIAKLVELRRVVDEAWDAARQRIAASAQQVNPHFSSIHGEKYVLYYKARGPKYTLDASQLAYIPDAFYATKTSYQVNAKQVEKFASEKGSLPVGIRENDRQKTIEVREKSSPVVAEGGSDEA